VRCATRACHGATRCSSAAASPTHAARLAANEALRRDIREAIAGGLSTYAECGGLM